MNPFDEALLRLGNRLIGNYKPRRALDGLSREEMLEELLFYAREHTRSVWMGDQQLTTFSDDMMREITERIPE